MALEPDDDPIPNCPCECGCIGDDCWCETPDCAGCHCKALDCPCTNPEASRVYAALELAIIKLLDPVP